MKKTFGYALMALSFLPWAGIAALPFLDVSVGMAAGITTGLIITGEVLFFAGIALVGREAWEKIKAVFRGK